MERGRAGAGAGAGGRPVPMKLFAAWEVDRTPTNCIPRLCTLRVTRLRVCGWLSGETACGGGGGGGASGGGGAGGGGGGGAVTLAARMHSSKRTLRSNDIAIPPNDVELDLCFSLQYPHFVKRDGNRLQIMLQRRKKYKNRTILGYKTLAEGVIRMDQVLQRSMDMELELMPVGAGKGGAGGGGGAGAALARLTITGLASTPVDHDTKNNNMLLLTADRGYSDEEEEGEFSSVEETDDMTYGAPARRRPHRPHRQIAFNKADLSYTKQRNLKQKFAALLRRFRVPEELAERDAARDTHHPDREIDELFQELESLSCGEGDDSGPDQMDTISIGSTPKPSLRPFFSSSRSLAASAAAGHATHPDHHRHSAVARHLSVASAGDAPLVLPAAPLAAAIAPAPALAAAPVPAPPAGAPGHKRAASSVTLGESELARSSLQPEAGGGGGGSECNSEPDATADAAPSGASLSSSPPKEKEEKRSRLFRSATSGGNLTPSGGGGAGGRKKNSLSISTGERPLSGHEFTAQSPTMLEPRRSILEQTARVLGEEGCVPESVALLGGGGAGACALAAALAALGLPALPAHAPQDARVLLHALYTRLGKQASVAGGGGGGAGSGGPGKSARFVRVLVCGGDGAVAGVLRAYTELAARRPHDAAQPLRFYIVPIGNNSLSRQLCANDPGYAALFGGEAWSVLCDRGADASMQETADISSRIARYLSSAGGVTAVPIGEAMVAYRERYGDEDSSQTFVPFLTDVRLGCTETNVSSLELEEGGSPPARPSPPATPAPLAPLAPPLTELAVPSPPARAPEPLELQLDYWQAAGRGAEGGDSKVTVKAAFRALHVARQASHLHISYLTKEKKQKIMRLGKKKEKDREAEGGRTQSVDNVSRLICSAKSSSHNLPLKVYIDGTEWNGVKFFQLSTQWQTHVKHFPVATSGAPLAPQET